MDSSHFILFRSENALLSSRLEELPMALSYRGQRYKGLNSEFGDFNHLVDAERTLWGFHLSSPGLFSPRLLQSPTWLGCRNVFVDDSELFVLLGERSLAELIVDCAQITGVAGFASDTDQFIIALPEIASFPNVSPILWERIGFPMQPAVAAPNPVA